MCHDYIDFNHEKAVFLAYLTPRFELLVDRPQEYFVIILIPPYLILPCNALYFVVLSETMIRLDLTSGF